MSKKTELEVMERIGRSITASGVRVMRTGLVFDKVDERALHEAGAFLQTVDACSAWWWGDYLAAYCGYEVKAEEAEHGPMDEITKGDRLKQYTARYAAIAGKEPKTLWQYLWIARFYNFSCRQEELTWTHHVEATVGAEGDLAKAQKWLDAAVNNRWSASELRAAIRKTKRAEQEPDEPMPQYVLPLELVQARRWGSAHLESVAEADMEELVAQVREVEPLIEWWKRAMGRIQAASGTGKESFLHAD